MGGSIKVDFCRMRNRRSSCGSLKTQARHVRACHRHLHLADFRAQQDGEGESKGGKHVQACATHDNDKDAIEASRCTVRRGVPKIGFKRGEG